MKTAYLVLIGLPTLLLFTAEPVTYSQIFAERHITLTEKMTLFEKHLLPHKKGFVAYE